MLLHLIQIVDLPYMIEYNKRQQQIAQEKKKALIGLSVEER